MYIIGVVDLRLSHLSLTPYEMHCPMPLHSLYSSNYTKAIAINAFAFSGN